MNVNRIVQLAAFIGFTVASSLMVVIPIPVTGGNLNPIEVGIFVAASLFGAKHGALVGAFSGALLDLLSGFVQWAPFSFVIYALVGGLVGLVANQQKRALRLIVAYILGSIVMVVLYYVATIFIYGSAAALASIVPNIIQSAFACVVGFLLLKIWFTVQKTT